MQTILLAFAMGLVSPCGLRAEGADELPYFTNFGDNFLRKAPLVVRARVRTVSPIRGGEIVQVDVLQVFKGKESDRVVILANPREFFVGGEQILFLAPYQGGGRYTQVNRFGIDDDTEAKLRCLREHLEIEKLQDEEARKKRVRRFLRENCASADRWTRWNVILEVKYILRIYPDLLTDLDREDLLASARRSADAEFRKAMLALLNPNRD